MVKKEPDLAYDCVHACSMLCNYGMYLRSNENGRAVLHEA